MKFNSKYLTLYLLGFGILSILIFLYMSFGIASTILGFGIFLILSSVIIELNELKKLKENYYD
ncbi:MAG: hypothetical protein ACRC57_00505 [Sarcina sp.]